MAKIILSTEAGVLREVALAKERITIGRGVHNDIVIDDRAISAEHAIIVTMGGDSFLEDQNSTNGTQVNGQPVRKHFLQEGDVIEVAGYHIRYANEDLQPELVRDPGNSQMNGDVPIIKVMNGPSAGKEIPLVKQLTTLGSPGVQVAAIARRSQRYYLTHIAGNTYPIVNGKSIGIEQRQIANGDIIDLSVTSMQFLFGR